MNTPRTRYSTLLVAIHWLTAVLVLIAYLISEGGRRVRLDPPQWHFFLGFAVLLLVAVPVTGWVAASMMGVVMTKAGITVPPIATAVEGRIGLIGDVHQWGGNAILVLAGLHAVAALWHHFFLKDATLRRMKPF